MIDYYGRGDTAIGLPDPKPNVLYLATRGVCFVASNRDDLIHTHHLKRKNGQIVGCREFAARSEPHTIPALLSIA